MLYFIFICLWHCYRTCRLCGIAVGQDINKPDSRDLIRRSYEPLSPRNDRRTIKKISNCMRIGFIVAAVIWTYAFFLCLCMPLCIRFGLNLINLIFFYFRNQLVWKTEFLVENLFLLPSVREIYGIKIRTKKYVTKIVLLFYFISYLKLHMPMYIKYQVQGSSSKSLNFYSHNKVITSLNWGLC